MVVSDISTFPANFLRHEIKQDRMDNSSREAEDDMSIDSDTELKANDVVSDNDNDEVEV